MQIPVGLTIAGSDSSGGAGIQADIKTFSAFGVYCGSVITALTAQNSLEVAEALAIPKEFVESQLNAVCSDLNISGIKVGMLMQEDIINEVADFLESYGCEEIVFDPVMVSQSGHRLLEEDAIQTLKKRFMPLCRIITPNLYEASILVGSQMDQDSESRMEEWGYLIREMGAENVLIKGGHSANPKQSNDLFVSEDGEVLIENERIATQNTHGTGCSLSSAICAEIINGKSLKESVISAENYIQKAIKSGKDKFIGRGNGPIDHFCGFS